jgi:hypothetical protein
MLTKTNNKVMLNDRWYSIGKKLVQVWLPAFSALYFGLASIWGLPYAEQVVGTTACITTFFGVSLNLSSKQYDASGAAFDGDVVISENPETGTKLISLELSDDPVDIESKDRLTFNVRK